MYQKVAVSRDTPPSFCFCDYRARRGDMALREETRDSMARQGMAYWRANRERLTEQYPGQYLLIAEQAVRGVFGSRMEADEEGNEAVSR